MAKRYERNPMVLTSDLPSPHWARAFANLTQTAVLLEWLLRHATLCR